MTLTVPISAIVEVCEDIYLFPFTVSFAQLNLLIPVQISISRSLFKFHIIREFDHGSRWRRTKSRFLIHDLNLDP